MPRDMAVKARWQRLNSDKADSYRKRYRLSAKCRVGNQSKQAVLRERVIQFLGGVCIRCGFTDSRALQIDHEQGGGSRQRREVSWSVFYKQLLDDSTGYQLLCANCNWIKRSERKEACGRPILV